MILRFSVIGLAFLLFTPSMLYVTHAASSTPTVPAGTTFVWAFGYVGDTYYPQTELNLSPSVVLSTLGNLSTVLGGPSHLAIVSPVFENAGHLIQPSYYANVSAYVKSLHLSASLVFGRLGLDLFNTTSKTTIYSEAGKIYSLGPDGLFLDHAPQAYSILGQNSFNYMMQKLATEYPNHYYILNHQSHLALIAPLSNDTWQQFTWVSPGVKPGTYENVQLNFISKLNQYWQGKQILHLDADAKNANAPMGIFADQTAATEESAVTYMVGLGVTNGFNFLYPVIGAWTYSGSIYGGNLYNSLATGNQARSTLSSFTITMLNP